MWVISSWFGLRRWGVVHGDEELTDGGSSCERASLVGTQRKRGNAQTD